MRRLAPGELKAWLADGRELGLVDAREEGEFGLGHLFWAAPLPLSRLPLMARALLPNPSVRLVVTDDGRGLAESAAAELEAMGYTEVAVLSGGTTAWREAGYRLFSGVNVPSKAFGEWVEHACGTPSIDAAELKALMERGEKLVVLDARPFDEFRRMSIPGGVCVPGGELAYRIGDLVPDAETLIVVNCAGRTRSIIGAESLRAVGVPNRVVALRNGTMGWDLAGFACASGESARFPAGRPASAATALARAEALRLRHGVGLVDRATLETWRRDESRTLYVLDVRDPEEYAAGHLGFARSAPGGQLVQATDAWIAVRHARIVLVDDDGVRARMTAQWLARMGHRDVHVLEGAQDEFTATGPWVPPGEIPPVEMIPLPEAHAAWQGGRLCVIDLARSIDFRAGRIPGALWGVRTRLEQLAGRLPQDGLVAVTSPDGNRLARLAVEEVEGLTSARVGVLERGTAGWAAAGLPLETDRSVPADEECIDWYLRPYDRNDGVAEAMRAYLQWEIDLLRAVAAEGDVDFR